MTIFPIYLNFLKIVSYFKFKLPNRIHYADPKLEIRDSKLETPLDPIQ